MHGGAIPDPYFRLNPNFEVSHIVVGIKLFVYSVYYMLFKYQMVSSETTEPHTPPDFKWIHPEELLLFFWTEKNLLEKLASLLKELQDTHHAEHLSDIHLLSNLFISMQEHDNSKDSQGIKFIPTPKEELERSIQTILEVIHKAEDEEDRQILDALPPAFSLYLDKIVNFARHGI